MLTPGEAERLIRENMPLLHREDCPLAAAHGRILRADLCADRDLPPFDRVTMDGYALRASALAAGTRTFRIEGVQAAGMVPRTLGASADACVEIMTGAVLPSGADCVVPYEETTRANPGTTVTVNEAAAKFSVGNAVHRRGGDHRGGEVIVRAGTRLTGREIAVAAACGYAALTVAHSPKIAVVATGDELVEVEADVALHQIRHNGFTFKRRFDSDGEGLADLFWPGLPVPPAAVIPWWATFRRSTFAHFGQFFRCCPAAIGLTHRQQRLRDFAMP
jgi:molybdopterin molybdotransferase